MGTVEKTRFDTRLTKEQKEFFEYAASIGGFKTLSDFVLSSAQEKAKSIVENYAAVLASKKDQEIFFKTLLNPPAPNKSLKEAAAQYRKVAKNK